MLCGTMFNSVLKLRVHKSLSSSYIYIDHELYVDELNPVSIEAERRHAR